MNVVVILSLVAMVAAGAQAQSRPGGAADTNAPAGFEAYQVVVDRNIFTKDRRSKSTAAAATSQASPPGAEAQAKAAAQNAAADDPGRKLVLTGLTMEGDTRVAFFENEGGVVTRARVGEIVGGRKLMAISLDHVEIVAASGGGAGATVIVMGRTLAGTEPASRASAAASSAAPTAGGTSLAERMRAKREAELQKTAGKPGPKQDDKKPGDKPPGDAAGKTPVQKPEPATGAAPGERDRQDRRE